MDVNEYLAKFYKGTKNPSLRAMQYFMEQFDHPEKKLRAIHIAGTNGKGSCTEMMTNILINAGYKVGKFISPHLIRYNERLSIQNNDISDQEMEVLINEIKPKIEQYNNTHDVKVTLFELETTMALLYFYRNNCDFVVLETGLGGLYDCTNVIHPLVSIITSVGYDHMHILGNTLPEIAVQKAGIIKPNSHTVYVMQEEQDVNDVIIQTCKRNNNMIHAIQKEDITNYSYNNEFQQFNYKDYEGILVNLKGEKQVSNSCICIECTEVLRSKGYNISDKALRKGLKTVIHRARFETIYANPTIVFDGGHNKPAIDNFMHSVKMYYQNDKKVYVISILKTKDYRSILNDLLQDEDATFIFTDGNDEHAYTPKEEMLEYASKQTKNEKLYAQSLNNAVQTVTSEYKECVIFFVGSFYIYGSVTELLNKI